MSFQLFLFQTFYTVVITEQPLSSTHILFSLTIESPNCTADGEFGHVVTSPASSIFLPESLKTSLLFLGRHVSTETHQLYLLPSKYGNSYFSSCAACRQMIHHWTNFFLLQYSSSSSSSSSVSASRSDNPPWKCSRWQMCAWRSSIIATIRESELYPLVSTMQWSSALLLYGKHPGHDVPAVIPWPCTSNLYLLPMWTCFILCGV